jgi:glutathione synthase
MRILVVIDPLDRLDLAGDSSYAIMLEAARRGHELWACDAGELSLEHEDPVARGRPVKVRPAERPADAFTEGEAAAIPLSAFDVVLMRKDPPLDVEYLQATWILEQARGQSWVVNDPRGLRELNEHLAILRFPELIPPTVVTRDIGRLHAFLTEQGGTIVVKPVDGYGGRGIFVVHRGDPNTASIFETATADGRRWTQAQRYLPEAREGDKRIVLVAGEPIGAVLRVPPEGEARGNLHVGGRATATELDKEDWAIIRAVKPVLAEHGILFSGIDVIGGRLTEINITSPTGLRHIDQLTGKNSAAPVIDALERGPGG